MRNWLHSNGSKWQITILLTDDWELQDKKAEQRSQMFVYRLSPFPFPHHVIFSPFPQTGSLFTGYFYVGIPHQSCGGWTLFFYSNTFFCYNKFSSALYINLWIFAICTSPIIHFVCQPPPPPFRTPHHHPNFFITYGFNFLWVSQSSQEKLKTILKQNFGV